MSNQSTKSARLLFGAALTSLLLVSACDRQGERLERAREIADRIGIMVSGRLVRVIEKEEIAAADLAAIYTHYIDQTARTS